MLQYSKETDERRDAGPVECWCLHGSVGMAADWRGFSKQLATSGIGTRAVDLWRFLDCCPMPLPDLAKSLNAEGSGEILRGSGRSLLGYSMGGRIALHALLEPNHSWQAAVIVSANPGLENDAERAARRASDTEWATRALTGNWQQFLEAWNSQPLLGTAAMRDTPMSNGLVQRRREIARSFVDWSLGVQQPLWQRLSEISVPVLWIAGENDPKYRALAARAAALTPGSSLAIAPNSGHRAPWEAEAWFADTVSRFLKLGSI